jgi:hypothetical protein
MASKRKDNRLPPFVALTWQLLNSIAYKKLPPSAAKALPYFLGKIKYTFRDPEKYSTEFTFSYPEGLRLGFAHSTFAKIIRDLEAFGFIDWVVQGGMRGKGKGYNRFKLTQRWEHYNSNPLSEDEQRERKAKRTDMAIYRIPSN